MILTYLSNANDDVQRKKKNIYRVTNKLLLDLIYMHARFIVSMRLPDHVLCLKIEFYILYNIVL